MSHSSISRLRAAQCLLLMLAAPMYCAGPADAQSRPNQIHTSPQQDPGVYSGRLKVDYPTPYDPATVEQIGATLERVLSYLDQAAPVQVIDGETGAPVTDLTKLPTHVALARTDIQILTYEWGVTYAGMLRSAQATGDERYTDYVNERVTAIATVAAHSTGRSPLRSVAPTTWPPLMPPPASKQNIEFPQ